MPIYPARELPIEGVTSERILEKMKIENKRVLEKDELLAYLEENRPDVLLTVGAGDIDKEVSKIAALFDPDEPYEE